MKKILLIATTFFAITQTYSQTGSLLLADNFDYTAGNLGSQGSWTSPSGTNAIVVSATNATGVVYPGYTSGTNYITLANGDQSDPYKGFNGAASLATNAATVYYVSFVMKVTSAVSNGGNGDRFLTLSTVAGSGGTTINGTSGRIYVKSGSVASTFNIAVSTSGNPNTWSGNFSFNTSYLIVMKYVNGAAGNDDNMYLWVNPANTSEPSTGSATVTDSGNDDFSSGTDFVKFLELHQRANGAGLKLDAIRASYATGGTNQTINSAAAWTNLASAGAPLPVKLGIIKAYEKQNGVQIDWTAYSEENLSKYQVERSSNGLLFTSIGYVAARNLTAEAKYGFFDANPLPGINFYRLKNIDLDGKTGFSSIVKVNLDKSVKGVTVYPNPVTGGYVSFQSADLVKGNYSVKVFNAGGQQVYSQQFIHNGGAINQTIQLPGVVKSGMYSMQLDNEGMKVMSKTFIVQ